MSSLVRCGLVFLIVVLCASAVAAQPELTMEQLSEAMTLGRRCQAAITRVTSPDGDFEMFIETPAARAALVTATAVMMRQRFDAPNVRRAMQSGSRIWAQRRHPDWRPLTLQSIAVRDGARTFHPIDTRAGRFVLGSVPSHGIVESLRTRFPEFVFATLPPAGFDVLVRTSKSTQVYRVTPRDREQIMRVCN